MRRLLYRLQDWVRARRKERRRARYFRELRRRRVAFGGGFQSPLERETDRQRQAIAQERTRHAHHVKEGT